MDLLTKFYSQILTPFQLTPHFIHHHLAMNRATTPVLKSHEAQTHHPTPTRAKIQGAVEFCDAMKISYFKEDVFRVFGTSKKIY